MASFSSVYLSEREMTICPGALGPRYEFKATHNCVDTEPLRKRVVVTHLHHSSGFHIVCAMSDEFVVCGSGDELEVVRELITGEC